MLSQAVHLSIAAYLLQENRELYPACNKVISHLTAVSEELVDVPLYFSLHDVCKTVKCTPPKADVLRSALINAGEFLLQAITLQALNRGRSFTNVPHVCLIIAHGLL